MNRCIIAVIACSLGALLNAASQSAISESAQPKPVTIRIDAARRSSFDIPRTIFGSFLEPIGNSTYNGLWSEILQNPSFEENLWSARNVARMIEDEPTLARASDLALPLPWEPLDVRQGNRYDADDCAGNTVQSCG